MKKNKVYSLGVGTTSILIIFVVVCLSILSSFSYVIANKDSKITNKKTEYNMLYQQADSNAVEKLAQIDNVLYKICKKNISINDKKAKKLLSKIDGITIDYKENKISYEIPIKNNSYIGVKLKINTNKNNKITRKKENYNKNKKSKTAQRVTIIDWKLINNAEEISETMDNLWMN